MFNKAFPVYLLTVVLVLFVTSRRTIIDGRNWSHASAYKAESLPPTDAEGELIYKSQCLSCHQADGSGVPNMYPPLRKSEWVNGDKTKLINIVLKGLQGEIEVNGEYYNQAMPKHDSLTDGQVAQVLTYIRKNFGNNAIAIMPSDVKRIREAK